MLRTHSSLPKSLNKNHNHSKSMNNFILLNKNRQVQFNYQWKPLKVKQALLHRTSSLNRQISFGPSYAHKKSILLTLNQPIQNQITNISNDKNQFPSKKSISTQVFFKSKLNLNIKQSTESSELKLHDIEFRICKNIQRMESKLNKFMSTTTSFNQKVQKNILNFKQSRSQRQILEKVRFQTEKSLEQRIRSANFKGKRVVSVLTMNRYGLRIRLKRCFVEVCVCQKIIHRNDHMLEKNQQMNFLVRQMLSIGKSEDRGLYYFDLNKQPLISSDQLAHSESVILACQSPVLNIENEFHFKIYEEAQNINSLIRTFQLSLDSNGEFQRSNIKNKSQPKYHKKKSLDQQGSSQSNNQETKEYDWQKISDINGFVEKILENPEHIKMLNKTQRKKISYKDDLSNFYNQKFDTITKPQTGQNFRNPLLEDHSHYQLELTKKKMLAAISAKLQQQNFIKNQHIVKPPSIQALVLEDKIQKQKQIKDIQRPNIINRNIRNTQTTKKSILRQLDSKNPLLFEQNIPYLLDKYGISRYEIHNLFTIYKTLQKISGMRFREKNNASKILKKGIDRSTFDQGMKRLDINPGEEVIKNICYFGDFISWEHFLKIVSIGLRKTPQQKLQAILIGIGGTNNGCLTRNQISLMIGNSLNKIFDSEQSELKEYFTEMAMKDLDGDGSGTVDVREIKNKCLTVSQINPQNGQNMDLITFLLLNS